MEFKSIVVNGPNEHGFQQTIRQPIDEDQVRVRVAAVAFCGTDFKLMHGLLHDASYPVTPGHEWSGHVIEAPGAPELMGALVVASIYLPCGACTWCRTDNAQHCEALDEVGFTLPGGCAEEIVVPRSNVRAVPHGIAPEAACLLEPLTIAVHAVDRAPAMNGQSVAVLGAGAVGLLLLQLIQAAGGHCTVVEPLPGRRSLAKKLGAHTALESEALPQSSFEVVFDATGSPTSFGEGLGLLAPLGTLLLVGYSGDLVLPFAPSRLMLKEATVRGVLSGVGTLDRAIESAASGEVDLDCLIAAPIPIEEYSTLLVASQDVAPRQPMIFELFRKENSLAGSKIG